MLSNMISIFSDLYSILASEEFFQKILWWSWMFYLDLVCPLSAYNFTFHMVYDTKRLPEV